MSATEDEVNALATALYYAKEYDDSNPDVGMGPSVSMLFSKVCGFSGIKVTESLKARVYRRARAAFGMKC